MTQPTNQRKQKTQQIAVTGMLATIIVILSFTPLGFIPLGVIGATTLHLPVLVGLFVEGPVVGIVLTLIFGVCSILRAATSAGLLNPFFLNPLVSVLPRLFIPMVAWAVYRWVGGKEEKNKDRQRWGAALGALAGSVTNTIGTLGMIYLVYGARLSETILQLAASEPSLEPFVSSSNPAGALMLFISMTNGIPEAVLTVITVPMIVMAVKAVKRRV